MKICGIDGCNDSVHAKGWCSIHYGRWRRHGDPLTEVTPAFHDKEKLLEYRTIPEPNSGCLLWTGSTTRAGHGTINTGGEVLYAHRWVYEKGVGPIPEGAHVDHKCHVPQCVNVEHLRLATRSQNLSNRKGPSRLNTSGFRNVYWSKERRCWYVQVVKEGKRRVKYGFKTPEEASVYAEQLREELFGEFAGKG